MLFALHLCLPEFTGPSWRDEPGPLGPTARLDLSQASPITAQKLSL